MKNYCFVSLFLIITNLIFAQEKQGKIDLDNEQQINVLTLKNGARYVGKIQSMNAKTIVFKLDDYPELDPLVLRRKNIKIISSYNPSNDNGGVLRLPFSMISKDFPDIILDPKLDVKNYQQQVEIWQDGKVAVGRIRQVRKAGLQLLSEGELTFFRFLEISEINVLDWSYLDVKYAQPDPDFLFQVNSFEVDTTLISNDLGFKVDADFDLNNELQRHLLLTKMGNRFNGKIVKINKETVELKMQNGSSLYFPKKVIKKVEIFQYGYRRKVKKGKVKLKKYKEFTDKDYILAQNRLFASPTGFGLKKGEVEYRNVEIFFNEISYATSNNFTISGGIYPVIDYNILTLKASANFSIGEYIHLSGGSQLFVEMGGFNYELDGKGTLTGFAAVSIGSPAYFINVAYNKWTSLDGFSDGDVVSVGGSFKISQKFRLFADVIFSNEESSDDFFFEPIKQDLETQPVLMLGSSWFNKVNKVDFGFLLAPNVGVNGGSTAVILPIASYTRRF